MKNKNDTPEAVIAKVPTLKIELLKSHTNAKPREIEFNEMINLPNIINDHVYISRKRTIDTFVRRENLESLKKQIKKGIDEENMRRISEDEQLVLSKKRKLEYEKEEKKRKNFRGCMFAHELWSDGYYNMIISSSYIKSKCDEISNALKGRKLNERIKKTHELFSKTHKDFKFHRGSVDFNNQEDEGFIRRSSRETLRKKTLSSPRKSGLIERPPEKKITLYSKLKTNEILKSFYAKDSLTQRTLRQRGNNLTALSSPVSKKSIIFQQELNSSPNNRGNFSHRLSLIRRNSNIVAPAESGTAKWGKKGCHLIVNNCSKVLNDNKVMKGKLERELNIEQNLENKITNQKIVAEIERRLAANKEAEKAVPGSFFLKDRGSKKKAFCLYESDSDDGDPFT